MTRRSWILIVVTLSALIAMAAWTDSTPLRFPRDFESLARDVEAARKILRRASKPQPPVAINRYAPGEHHEGQATTDYWAVEVVYDRADLVFWYVSEHETGAEALIEKPDQGAQSAWYYFTHRYLMDRYLEHNEDGFRLRLKQITLEVQECITTP